MKKKKSIIIIIISILVVIGIAIGLYFILNDKDKLTVSERNWVNQNIGTIQNINVINNVNVFGKNGSGVFYDFISDFETEYGLSINPITFNEGSNPSGISFGVKNIVDDNDILFYTDHYVLVGKNNDYISTEEDLNGKNIDILSKDLSYVSKYVKKASNVVFKQFENIDEIILDMNENETYMLVPLMEYLDTILSKDYKVVYHFSDIKEYYVLSLSDDKLSSVLKKYYNKWNNEFDNVYNDNLFKTFTSAMNITDTEVDSMQSITYNYGFVNASPYEVILGGKYGGIVAVYLSNFSKFADIEFNFVKYKTFNKFMKAVNNKDIDLYFNYYTLTNNYKEINTHMNIEYNIIAKESNSMVVNSLDSLKGKTVYVLQDSMLYNYLSTIDDITINTYRNVKELKKIAKQDNIIMIDHNTYETYANKELSGYTVRYTSNTDGTYNFKVREDGPFYKTLNAFIKLQDPNLTINEGLYNYTKTLKSGTVLGTIAKYSLYLIIGFVVIMYLLYKSTKRVKISKKIKKVEKIRYIDQLTSLKNRNYLNENINAWNKNTIYPQATIVLDLNRLQEINDTLGYEKGDRQIKAAANILIKTQLDNSDIMRTDGNEFLIYLVGYEERQIISYIKKLYKEFKNLPYEYGATIGHSMITNDLKSIEDAINESVEDMKQKKQDLNRE